MMKAAVQVQPSYGQDRAVAIPASGGYVIAVADGAGGTGGGAAAAESMIAFVRKLAATSASTDWFEALCTFDDELSTHPSGGQTTAIVAFIDECDQIKGASVGDSSACLISSSGHTRDLTGRQRRKPLLGSGEALPVEFKADRRGDRVLLGSDGLFKYAPLERICTLALQGPVEDAANAHLACVRLPSGVYQDNVAVVLFSG